MLLVLDAYYGCKKTFSLLVIFWPFQHGGVYDGVAWNCDKGVYV